LGQKLLEDCKYGDLYLEKHRCLALFDSVDISLRVFRDIAH